MLLILFSGWRKLKNFSRYFKFSFYFYDKNRMEKFAESVYFSVFFIINKGYPQRKFQGIFKTNLM